MTRLLKRHGEVVQRWLAIPEPLAGMLTPEDIMQEAYLEAFLRIDSVPTLEAEFRAWFGELADNCLRDATRVCRALQRGGNNPLAGASGVLHSFSSRGATPESVRRNRRFEEMRRIATQLPDPYRTAAEGMLDDLTPDRIARQLGKSAGTTYVVMGRARQLLGQGLRRWREKTRGS
jgi:DNA-directed RNA polymerase specialized sigma24 family protein